MHTQQETFDLAARFGIEQGGPSFVDGRGAYRDGEGRKCPVGHLIPDTRYTKALEGKSAAHPLVANILRDEGHDPAFAAYLQHAHDVANMCTLTDEAWLRKWAEEMHWLAQLKGLSTAALDEALAKRGIEVTL